MNRIRIAALTAVALGVTVTAATKFYARQAETQMAFDDAAARNAPPPLQDSIYTDADRLTLVQAQVAPIQIAQNSTVPLSEASVVPRIDVGASDHPVVSAELDPANALNGTPVNDQPPSMALDDDMPSAPSEACQTWLVTTPADSAMIELSLYSPCDADTAVQIEHAEMTVDARLDSNGQLNTIFPALRQDARVSVTMLDGREVSDGTIVADMAAYSRLIVGWSNPASLVVNVYENGAIFGQPGHVNPRNARQPNMHGDGYLSMVGDPVLPYGRVAQVYTYPRGLVGGSNAISVEIEADITTTSCGRQVEAYAAQVDGTNAPELQQMTVELPGCDGVGGFVVLPDLVPQSAIALN
ncbi:MAG: hypothetical protein R3D60_10540 [Paracoccaceae bacterium]